MIFLRVAIYCRVSTEDQFLDKQELELREFCVGRGYDVFKVYSDVISGSRDSRPALNVFNAGAGNIAFNDTVNNRANLTASGATITTNGAWGGTTPLRTVS